MTTFVLGAGASYHVGYPLARAMGSQLFNWMNNHSNPGSGYGETAQFFKESFGITDDIEDLLTQIQKVIHDFENGTFEQRCLRAMAAQHRNKLVDGVREWFSEIRERKAIAYRTFAQNMVKLGDCVITFNYDLSLERELRLADKWEIGDGYGFTIQSLPMGSATKVLKLHGSTSWLALLFEGMTSGLCFSAPGGRAFGQRPVIAQNDLKFLGYGDHSDPAFPNQAAALPAMIMPARAKEFFFDTNAAGIEFDWFWDHIWQQATHALKNSDEIVICGYSLNSIDQRACDLLLSNIRNDANIIVGSGADTDLIVKTYRDRGYSKAIAAEEVFFEKWVEHAMNTQYPHTQDEVTTA